MRRVIVVESGAKTRTIRRLVRGEYDVIACGGHILELPEDGLGVDVENGFSVEWVPRVSNGRSQVEYLRDRLEGADEVYIASDPDREGEAIAADILEHAVPEGATAHRITFNAIVYSAIQEALERPRGVDADLVEAQRARSTLDRLIGFVLSDMAKYDPEGPKAPSVGRVQSPAVALVVDREAEISAFESREFWTVHGALAWEQTPGEEPVTITADFDGEWEEEDWGEVLATVEGLNDAGALEVVDSTVDPESLQNPLPPFTTDTLQEAADAPPINLTPEQTMRLAQELYEGVDIDGDTHGLITYMRTDSTRVSPAGMGMARKALTDMEGLGEAYYKGRPWSGGDGAQDAHEAIRPTHADDPNLWPANLEGKLDERLLDLYRLIFNRFLASQMAPAVYETTTLTLEGGGAQATAEGHRLREPGYLKVYREIDPNAGRVEVDVPGVPQGTRIPLLHAYPEPRRTYPPARYREGSLVRALKEQGIGRPSTYSRTLEKIKSRRPKGGGTGGYGYVRKRRGQLQPAEKGEKLVEYLRTKYPRTVDYAYTARMEESLDEIAEGRLDYQSFLEREFEWLKPAYQRTREEGWIEGDHPTPAQLEHLEQLMEETGTRVPDADLESKAKVSQWITKLHQQREPHIDIGDIHEADAGGVPVHRFFILLHNTRLPDEVFEELTGMGFRPMKGGGGKPPRLRYQRQDRGEVEDMRQQARKVLEGAEVEGLAQ